MFFKCCLFIFQKGTLWRAGKRNGHIWVKCWINILLLSFLLSFLFSFLASSSRPLETLKLWFLPSRPLPEGGGPKTMFIYFFTPPLRLQETSFQSGPAPRYRLHGWHYGTGRTDRHLWRDSYID